MRHKLRPGDIFLMVVMWVGICQFMWMIGTAIWFVTQAPACRP